MNENGTLVTLEVLNPRGVLRSVPVTGLKNPRPTDLAGKRIALLSEKEESLHFFDAVEALLKERYPTATVLRFDSPANPSRPDNTAEVAAACDVWLQGVKTSGSSVKDYDVKLEQLGKPGAPLCIDSLQPQRRRLAEVNGMPTLRIIPVPAKSYMGAEGYPDKMQAVAASIFETIVHTLTDPLTDAEKKPNPFEYDYGPRAFEGRTYTEVEDAFQRYAVENYLTDGFPVVPPTREAVDRMLTGTSRDPQEELGIMSPRPGMATIEKIAVNAVMAGARPEYLPVIIAAVECLVDKNFNLYHLSSTWDPVPLIWVNGPIAEEIGMNAGFGFLGRGNHANNTIGRAVNLCIINIGWRLLNQAELGVDGRPEYFSGYVFPENEQESPWESFAVERGYRPEDSTVTVTETMQYVLGPGGGMSSQTWEASLAQLVKMIQDLGNPLRNLIFPASNRRHEIVLSPTLALQLAEAGFTRRSLAQWLYDHTTVTWEQMDTGVRQQIMSMISLGMIPKLKVSDCKPGLVIASFNDIRHIAILVAGDASGHSILLSSSIGSAALQPDSPPGAKDQPYITKVVRGATLTRAGH